MYNPLAKGRWYRAFIQTDGETYTIIKSDLENSISTGALVFPTGFHAIEAKLDVHAISNTESLRGTVNNNLTIMADGKFAVELPDKKCFNYMYAYVFGYFE